MKTWMTLGTLLLSFSVFADANQCNQYDLRSDEYRQCLRGEIMKKVQKREKARISNAVNTKSPEELAEMGYEDARKGFEQGRYHTGKAMELSKEGIKFGVEQHKNGMGVIRATESQMLEMRRSPASE